MSLDPDSQDRGDGRLTFAFKLWEVANDGKLIKWNSTGDGVIVEQREYEEYVHEYYPRFAQNSSFLNLKRLFRDYGFQPNVLRRKKPHGLMVEYFNPLFKRDDYENLINVTAKERVYKYKVKSPSGLVYRARRKYTRRYPTHRSVLHSSDSTPIGTPSRSLSLSSLPCPPRKRGRPPTRRLLLTSSSSSPNSSFSELTEVANSKSVENNIHQLSNNDVFRLFQMFAKNELSEEMYVEAILKRTGHRFEHLSDGPFEDIVSALDNVMDPGLSPFCFSGAAYEYSLDEM